MPVQLASLCYVRNESDRTILMLRRASRQNDVHVGKWNGLGGKFEKGESPEQCAIREIREESGLDVILPRFAGVLTFPNFSEGKDWYVFVFMAEQFTGQLRESEEGSLHWICEKELLSLPLWEGDRLFIPLILKRQFFSARLCYRDGCLVDHVISTY